MPTSAWRPALEAFVQSAAPYDDIVVKPTAVQDIQNIVELCTAHQRPIRIDTVFGDHLHGVVLDMSAFSNLIALDHLNHKVTVGAFISGMDLQFHLHRFGLDLASHAPALNSLGASLLNGAWICAGTPLPAGHLRPMAYDMITGAGQPYQYQQDGQADVPADLIWRSFWQLGIPTQITLPVRPGPEASFLMHISQLSLDMAYGILTEALGVMPFDHVYLERAQGQYQLHFVHQGSEHSCVQRHDILCDILSDHSPSVAHIRQSRDGVISHLEAIWGRAEYKHGGRNALQGRLQTVSLDNLEAWMSQRPDDQHVIYDALAQSATTLQHDRAAPATEGQLYPPSAAHRHHGPLYRLIKPQFDPSNLLNPL